MKRQSQSPWIKLFMVVILTLASFTVIWFLSGLLSIPFFGYGLNEMQAALTNYESNIGFTKFMQAAQSIGLFIIPALLAGIMFYRKNNDPIGLCTQRIPWSNTFLITVLLMIVAMPVINIIGEFNKAMELPDDLSGIEEWMRNMEDRARGISLALLEEPTLKGMLTNLLVIAVIPAIGEEFMFRGIIQRIFREMTNNPHAGVLIAAFLFGALHLQFFGILPRFLLGVLFGYLLVWTGSIWIPVIAHFTNNALAVLFYYFYANGYVSRELENIGANQNSLVYFLVSIFLIAVILVAIYKVEYYRKSNDIEGT